MPVAWIVTALAAYLLGSIPSGLLIGKAFFGIDVRDYGSHRTGATNVLRTMGKRAALAAGVMDVAKGVLAVLIARWLLPQETWAHALAALMVAVGHNWPVFVGFRGGRGVLVSFTAVAMLYWPAAPVLLAVGLLVVWRTRYVSMMSMVGAAAAAVLFGALYLAGQIPAAYAASTVVAASLIILLHKDNIGRLLAGTESRLGQRVHPTA